MSTKPRRIYLDHNATAPLVPAARAAIVAALCELGNPSSIHAEGQRARARVEAARQTVAELLGAAREDVVFTSGGTEANALGVLGLAGVAERRGLPRVVATTAIEHPSLAGAVDALVARGWTRVILPAPDGRAVVGGAAPAPGLVALAAVNHELGTVADLTAIAAWAHGAGALVHVDAVQAAGKRALAPITALADALAISAHKLGGPQGVGALALRVRDALPVLANGHHERGRRAGTENTIGIAGFGAAAAAVDLARWPAVTALAAELEAAIRALPGTRIHGGDAPRVGGTINAGFAGAAGDAIVMALDLAGIAASTGAACTSGTIAPSPVLLGLGLAPDAAREAVRFSLGTTTTAADIAEVIAALPAILARARAHH